MTEEHVPFPPLSFPKPWTQTFLKSSTRHFTFVNLKTFNAFWRMKIRRSQKQIPTFLLNYLYTNVAGVYTLKYKTKQILKNNILWTQNSSKSKKKVRLLLYTGGQKESIMLRFMLLSAYIGRQEAHRTPTAFRVIVMNVLDRLRLDKRVM